MSWERKNEIQIQILKSYIRNSTTQNPKAKASCSHIHNPTIKNPWDQKKTLWNQNHYEKSGTSRKRNKNWDI